MSKITCFSCGKQLNEPPRCSVCREATYCDHACQKSHWKTHKQLCKKETAQRFPFVLMIPAAGGTELLMGFVPRDACLPPEMDPVPHANEFAAIYHVKNAECGPSVGPWQVRSVVAALEFDDRAFYGGPLVIELLSDKPMRNGESAYDIVRRWCEAVSAGDALGIMMLNRRAVHTITSEHDLNDLLSKGITPGSVLCVDLGKQTRGSK